MEKVPNVWIKQISQCHSSGMHNRVPATCVCAIHADGNTSIGTLSATSNDTGATTGIGAEIRFFDTKCELYGQSRVRYWNAR